MMQLSTTTLYLLRGLHYLRAHAQIHDAHVLQSYVMLIMLFFVLSMCQNSIHIVNFFVAPLQAIEKW